MNPPAKTIRSAFLGLSEPHDEPFCLGGGARGCHISGAVPAVPVKFVRDVWVVHCILDVVQVLVHQEARAGIAYSNAMDSKTLCVGKSRVPNLHFRAVENKQQMHFRT